MWSRFCSPQTSSVPMMTDGELPLSRRRRQMRRLETDARQITSRFAVDAIYPLCHHSEISIFAFRGHSIGLRVTILASGSSGNMALLETERTRLLVDAGLGKRETLARLAAVENSLDHLDGILITHEHSDHCSGL